MIELKKVCKSYKKQEVVRDVTVKFETGNIVGIIGRNGSGKTVLFKMICGLVKPTSGVIYIDDKELGKDMDFPEHMGVIIETPGFLPWQTGFQVLWDLAKINKKIGKEEIEKTFEIVGLDPKLKTKVGKYSLGMRQRLGLAQALMENPDILILDEPMNGLDNKGVEDMRKLLLALKEQGKTILLASHNREDVEVLCDQVYEMDNGYLSEK
ncbi:MAG: ATP-binding cassette domain-containing protein [Eubacterium sp.]|nr:ATP-binding cassette domain-containing protein [Eubacterium sp.]